MLPAADQINNFKGVTASPYMYSINEQNSQENDRSVTSSSNHRRYLSCSDVTPNILDIEKHVNDMNCSNHSKSSIKSFLKLKSTGKYTKKKALSLINPVD